MSTSKILFNEVSKKQLDVSKMKDWVIVVPADAIPVEKYAAEEFQRLFKEATGAMLPIKSEAKSDFVHIGQVKGVSDDLDDEELLVVVEKDSVTITGGRPRGVLY